MNRKKTPLDKLLKIDKERELKNIAGEDNEKLEAMGQESETKAARWVKEEGEKERHGESERQAETEWKLSDARGKLITYKSLLIQELKRLMGNWAEDLSSGWSWYGMETEKGIVLWLRNPEREWMVRGMKVSGLPKYDLNGIFRIVMDALRESQPKKKEETPKVILPN